MLGGQRGETEVDFPPVVCLLSSVLLQLGLLEEGSYGQVFDLFSFLKVTFIMSFGIGN